MNRIDPNLWVDTYGDSLYSYALFRVENKLQAEELVQDTFVAALTARSTFAGKSSEKTWFFSILKNKIYDYLRRKYKETSMPANKLEAVIEENYFNGKSGWKKKSEHWAENPQRKFEEKEFLTVLKSCVDNLPAKQGHAFLMRELDELDNEEICKVLGVSSTNYWVLMHRARLKIRKCLENRWF
ncbi:MAG: RNA polymerase sigma-70 factor (TIGR02943 family) [Desulforhopalus sp.]|jgi:RNA polymerase sigma-70 factor (TIGR02943 family)